MRMITFLLILFFISPMSLIGNTQDSILMAERDYYYKKYSSVRDTMTKNTWVNLKSLSENLEQVVQRDQIIIDQYMSKVGSDTVAAAKDNGQKREMTNLELKVEQLESRTINDMRMLWILKTASGLMLLIILLMLYFLINERSRLSSLKGLHAFADKLSIEKRKENLMLEAELDKLRQREKDFRTELEKGLITHQDKLMMLQKKNNQLEIELKEIKEQPSGNENINRPFPAIKAEISNFPDNEKEIKELVQSLSDERNSLMNLAGRLQKQLETEKGRYQELMQKIKSIIGNNPDEKAGS